jgi:outer membrane protein assembly factor BamC
MQDSSMSFILRAPSSLPARIARVGAVTLAVLMVGGCTILQEDKIDYKSAKPGTTLDVPPDLTQLSRDNRYNVPGSSVTSASGQQAAQAAAPGNSITATNNVGDVRIERAGNQRWLVIDRPADQLWGPVTEFWKENGFILNTEQEKLGIMETDWAENRAKIPQDFIRKTIGKVFDNLYESGERDKFRTRLERSGDGKTEIYISHRGMMEVYTNSQKDQTAWQPRESDPELETEFLRRLMVKLGVSEAQSKAITAASPNPTVARVATVEQRPVVQIDEDFDRAWRRVGLALDRTGFTVEDRDRAQGIYFVRYVPSAAADAKKPGFFGRLFGSKKAEATPAKYQIKVTTAGTLSTVSVLDAQGQPGPLTDAQRIVQILVDDLK